jgi:hypothetical protein
MLAFDVTNNKLGTGVARLLMPDTVSPLEELWRRLERGLRFRIEHSLDCFMERLWEILGIAARNIAINRALELGNESLELVAIR